jgi:hypothetical protein
MGIRISVADTGCGIGSENLKGIRPGSAVADEKSDSQ